MARDLGEELSESESRLLDEFAWREFVGSGRGIWVRAAAQRLLVITDRRMTRSYACSTAKAGLGSRKDSRRTPQGWHEIAEKAGADLPAGAILDEREWSGEVWKPGTAPEKDLVLSRVLRLAGLQEGYNRGGDVDTWERLIYIHGTNAEGLLGTPASSGCVRLANSDVVELFGLVDVGCRALITPA